MSKRLDDISSSLPYQVIQVINETGSIHYLDSIGQKHLFAERRLITLKQKIIRYKKKMEYSDGMPSSFPSALSIEMDFDHCILSLRSSLEHLAQLINSVAKLGLLPTGDSRNAVSLKNVTKKIDNNPEFKNNDHLFQLSVFLNEEMGEDWFKELHNLRIEIFHHKAPDILNPRVDPNKMDELFLIPRDCTITAKTKRDREICRFCENKINDIEYVLYNSYYLLSKYLSR